MPLRSLSKKLWSGLQHEYRWGKLDRSDLKPSPSAQFEAWFRIALKAKKSAPPQAAVLATASQSGRPAARMVLIKGLDSRGFLFFTGASSPKARDLRENPRAELVFYWPAQERQVRVWGRSSRLSRKESEDYFQSRPREAQIAAWASRQSRPVAGRAELERRVREFRRKFGSKSIPLPPDWGGYVLRPQTWEFWQGRENRLNDRFLYRRVKKSWRIVRLEP